MGCIYGNQIRVNLRKAAVDFTKPAKLVLALWNVHSARDIGVVNGS